MKNYEKFKELYDEIDVLINNNVRASSEEFKAWSSKVKRFLINYYGQDSYEYKDFTNRRFSLSVCLPDTPSSKFIEACIKDLKVTKNVFKDYLEEMNKEEEIPKVENKDCEEVFIVHGHDGELKEAMARMLEKQGIKPIILSEQANKGQTIIEKIEEYSNVGAAIILFTGDDEGKEKEKNGNTYLARARQNVVFEAGYFVAKLGRNNVVIIKEDGVEIPGDLSGMVYTDKQDWKTGTLKELKSIGYKVDFNKLFE